MKFTLNFFPFTLCLKSGLDFLADVLCIVFVDYITERKEISPIFLPDRHPRIHKLYCTMHQSVEEISKR